MSLISHNQIPKQQLNMSGAPPSHVYLLVYDMILSAHIWHRSLKRLNLLRRHIAEMLYLLLHMRKLSCSTKNVVIIRMWSERVNNMQNITITRNDIHIYTSLYHHLSISVYLYLCIPYTHILIYPCLWYIHPPISINTLQYLYLSRIGTQHLNFR